jgi:zinc and cadmium transporter
MELILLIAFCLLGSIASVGLAGMLLFFEKERLPLLTNYLIPYAIGTLLGAAFFGMIPHAMSHIASESVLTTVLFGTILFFVLEKLTVWRHCHEKECDVHSSAGAMILVGDSIHNFVDGVAIAAAFLGSIPLGITTAFAIIAHEVPQEVGDFAILLASGYSKKRAFAYNAISSLTALIGAILSYFLLASLLWLVPYLLSLSAASFIYIALADLIPGRREILGLRYLIFELVLIAIGVGTIALLNLIRHG